MSTINRATVTFNERPEIRVDGKKQKFEMQTVDGKSFMGIKIGEDTYAKLTNRPDGKYDVTMFRAGGKELPDFPVKVNNGAVSRIQTAAGKFDQVTPSDSDGSPIKFNKDFATNFLTTAEQSKKSTPKSEKVETLLGMRDDLNERIGHLGKARHVPFTDAQKEFQQLQMELRDVERRLDSALVKPEATLDISLGSPPLTSGPEHVTTNSGSIPTDKPIDLSKPSLTISSESGLQPKPTLVDPSPKTTPTPTLVVEHDESNPINSSGLEGSKKPEHSSSGMSVVKKHDEEVPLVKVKDDDPPQIEENVDPNVTKPPLQKENSSVTMHVKTED